MSVRKEKRVTPDGKTRELWLVDVLFRHPNGEIQRVRRLPRVQSKAGAVKLERTILNALEAGTYQQEQPRRTPSVAEFAVTFLAWAQINN